MTHDHTANDAHSHMHGHDHGGPDHGDPDHGGPDDMMTMLDLDARVMGGYLAATAEHLAGLDAGFLDGGLRGAGLRDAGLRDSAGPAGQLRGARIVLDLGAGTGVGALALARAFPDAVVHALDVDPAMLAVVRGRAVTSELGDRVVPRWADLDDPDVVLPAPVDLVWASSSLHHVSDPAALLRTVRDALRPGGVVAILEMDHLPRVTGGVGPDGLEERLHAQVGWNVHPDWAPYLAAAGLEVVEQVEVVTSADQAAGAGEYARAWLQRLRTRADDVLDAADLAAVDEVLAGAALERADLVLTNTRTLWIARRPVGTGSHGAAAVATQVARGLAADVGADAGRTLEVDVAVVGGGPGGLGAAVALARSRRDVVVIDGGAPRNAPAEGAHNVLAREGSSPLALLAAGRAEARGYGVRIVTDRVAGVTRRKGGFTLTTAGGQLVHARRLVLATGLRDELPDVPGVRAHWGSSVLHCPYCHGWEVRGQSIGVLATSPMAMHQVLQFRQLTEQVTLLRQDVELGDDAWEQLAALGVRVVEGRVTRVVSDGSGAFVGVEVGAVEGGGVEGGGDHRVFELDALAVAPRFVANGELYEALGGDLADHPMGRLVPADEMGRTPLPDVWVVGNATDLSAMVSAAGAAGVRVGAALNAELAAAQAQEAVLEWRERGPGAFRPTLEREVARAVLGDAVHGLPA